LNQANKELKKELDEFKLSTRFNNTTNINKSGVNKRKANVKKILSLVNKEFLKMN